MADTEVITIPIDMPRDEATAFAELLKRTSYDDCLRRANRLKRYPDGRSEADVMWGRGPAGRDSVRRSRLRAKVGWGTTMPVHIPPEASPMIISETGTHVVIAVEIAKVTLLRHARFLQLLLEAAAPPGIGDHDG
jgi:hypothetical protein